MNWKTEAADKLRQYEARRNSLKSIPAEIEQIRISRAAIRSATADASPVRGGGSGREDMLLSSIVKEEELERSLEMARKWVDLVDAGLEILTEDERLVLDRFYLRPSKGAAERAATDLGVDVKTAYKRKDSALRRFTIALYGSVES